MAALRTSSRAGLVVGIVALLIGGNLALAFASDPAVPGDRLYGLDRAYEAVWDAVAGPTDRTDERLDEASVLITARGRVAEGLRHASDALSESNIDGIAVAREALKQAADEAEALQDEVEILQGADGFEMTSALRTEASKLLDIAKDVADMAMSGQDPSSITFRFAEQAMEVVKQAKMLRMWAPGLNDGQLPEQTEGRIPSNPVGRP